MLYIIIIEILNELEWQWVKLVLTANNMCVNNVIRYI